MTKQKMLKRNHENGVHLWATGAKHTPCLCRACDQAQAANENRSKLVFDGNDDDIDFTLLNEMLRPFAPAPTRSQKRKPESDDTNTTSAKRGKPESSAAAVQKKRKAPAAAASEDDTSNKRAKISVASMHVHLDLTGNDDYVAELDSGMENHHDANMMEEDTIVPVSADDTAANVSLPPPLASVNWSLALDHVSNDIQPASPAVVTEPVAENPLALLGLLMYETDESSEVAEHHHSNTTFGDGGIASAAEEQVGSEPDAAAHYDHNSTAPEDGDAAADTMVEEDGCGVESLSTGDSEQPIVLSNGIFSRLIIWLSATLLSFTTQVCLVLVLLGLWLYDDGLTLCFFIKPCRKPLVGATRSELRAAAPRFRLSLFSFFCSGLLTAAATVHPARRKFSSFDEFWIAKVLSRPDKGFIFPYFQHRGPPHFSPC